MIEIIENKIYFNGQEFQVYELEETCVHLINNNGDGYCVIITNEQYNQLKEI
jgi:hypothetical protein